MGRRSSDEEDRRRRRKKRRSRSNSEDSSESSGGKSSASRKRGRRRRSRSRSSRREGGSRSAKPQRRSRSRSGSRERRRRRSTSRDRKKTPRAYRSRTRSRSPRRSTKRSRRSRSRERLVRRPSSSASRSVSKERVEAFGKPLPPKPKDSSDDDEETRLAKELAKKKTPAAVFDIKVDGEESRHRQLARLEDDGFAPAAFKSSRGDKRPKRRGETDADPVVVVTEHEDAIFGRKSADVKPETAEKPATSATPLSRAEKLFDVKLAAGLADVDLTKLAAHPSLYEDPAIKDERWRKRWKEMRRKKMREISKGRGVEGAGLLA